MNRSDRRLLRLQRLAKQDNDNIYEKLSLVQQLLADDRWLQRTYDGERGAAVTVLQREYFRQVAGWISLPRLLQIFVAFPRPVWEHYRYDLRAMDLVYRSPELADSFSDPDATQAVGRRVAEMSYYVRYEGQPPEDERQTLERRLRDLEAERQRILRRLAELAANAT